MVEYKKIRLVLSSHGKSDTRYGDAIPTKNELYYNSLLHINDVRRIMQQFASRLIHDSYIHDWTKMEYIDKFHKDFHDARVHKIPFTKLEWYNLHILNENHHIYDIYKSYPEKIDFIDLVDVIHLCADWVASGKVRSESHTFKFDPEKFDVNIIKDILWYSFLNTLKKMDSATILSK